VGRKEDPHGDQGTGGENYNPSGRFAPSGGVGNAVDLSVFLLEQPDMAEKINLDSDRGYGYRQWSCDGGIPAGNIVSERFI
jgi:hypothetical protein